MLYIHDYGHRLDSMFAELFRKLEKDQNFYRSNAVLTADNFRRLPIDTTLILLSWFNVEGGLDNDTILKINEFKSNGEEKSM